MGITSRGHTAYFTPKMLSWIKDTGCISVNIELWKSLWSHLMDSWEVVSIFLCPICSLSPQSCSWWGFRLCSHESLPHDQRMSSCFYSIILLFSQEDFPEAISSPSTWRCNREAGRHQQNWKKTFSVSQYFLFYTSYPSWEKFTSSSYILRLC